MQSALLQQRSVSGAQNAFFCDCIAEQTVVIVDDDVEFCALLKRKLSSRGYRVEAYQSAQEYLNQHRPDGPSCLLLDIQMPGITGLELQERLCQKELSPSIVFVTGVEDLKTCLSAMKKGAEDYLIKPFEEASLFESVRVALAKCVKNWNDHARKTRAQELLDRLTQRERQILDLIIKGKINKEMADELNLAEVTIKVHRACLLKKLGTHSVVDLVRLVTCTESGCS